MLAALTAQGRFTIPVACTFPLENWRVALETSLSGRTLDSSQTPGRAALAGSSRALAAVDPCAIARALAGAGKGGSE